MSGCAGSWGTGRVSAQHLPLPRTGRVQQCLTSPGRAGGKEEPGSGKPSWTFRRNVLGAVQGMSLPGWVAAGWEEPDPCLSA